jgi:hypothetical protein
VEEVYMLTWYLAAVPSTVAGLPTWALQGLSVGSLVMFIVIGLATSRLWTSAQVTNLTKQHGVVVQNLTTQHSREVANLKAQYDDFIRTTVQQYEGQVAGAVKREESWREVALKWEEVVRVLTSQLEPIQEQANTSLEILRAWQTGVQQRQQGKRT